MGSYIVSDLILMNSNFAWILRSIRVLQVLIWFNIVSNHIPWIPKFFVVAAQFKIQNTLDLLYSSFPCILDPSFKIIHCPRVVSSIRYYPMYSPQLTLALGKCILVVVHIAAWARHEEGRGRQDRMVAITITSTSLTIARSFRWLLLALFEILSSIAIPCRRRRPDADAVCQQ